MDGIKDDDNHMVSRTLAHGEHGEGLEAESDPLLLVADRYQTHDLVRCSVMAATCSTESRVSAIQTVVSKQAWHHT